MERVNVLMGKRGSAAHGISQGIRKVYLIAISIPVYEQRARLALFFSLPLAIRYTFICAIIVPYF